MLFKMTPERKKLKTPSQDGDLLVEPSPQDGCWRRAVQDWNQRYWVKKLPTPIAGGETIGAFRAMVREQIAEQLPGEARRGEPLIVTGHQAEFYHAGVWAKNLAAYHLAQTWGGMGLNLVVDHDAPAHTSLSLPTAGAEGLALRRISLPTWQHHHAFEQFQALPKPTWQELDSVISACQSYGGAREEECSVWRAFHQGTQPSSADYVSQFMAGGQAAERSLGVQLPSVRTSILADTPAFRAWLWDVITHAEAFQSVYNGALVDYRRRYGFQGTQRPIPDLQRSGFRRELPFWVYWDQESRRRLWVEPHGESAHLFAEEIPLGVPDFSPNSSASLRVQLKTHNSKLITVSLRPRALTLTLFVRLFLADLFIHGIGGAKYDEMTDQIMQDYYHVEPPPMVCVSATVWLPMLPVEKSRARVEDSGAKVEISRIGLLPVQSTETGKRPIQSTETGKMPVRLRRAHWNPQELVQQEDTPELRNLADERRRLAESSLRLRQDQPHAAGERKVVYGRILALNEQLRRLQTPRLERLEQEWQEIEAVRLAQAVACNREYFFAALPSGKLHALRDRLQEVLSKA